MEAMQTKNSALREELAVFAAAVRFLTRLPLFPGVQYSAERFAAAPRYYPLVGVLLGLLLAVIFIEALSLVPPQVAAILTIAAGVLLTGGLHEDGFADFCDGLGGGDDKKRTLEIMRDSHLGSYGAIGLVLLMAAKITILGMLSWKAALVALPLMHGLGRLMIYVALLTAPPADENGLGQAAGREFSLSKKGHEALPVALFYIALFIAALWLGLGACALMSVDIAVIIAFFWIWRRYQRVLGGYTGDCLGALQQAGEVAVLLGVVICI